MCITDLVVLVDGRGEERSSVARKYQLRLSLGCGAEGSVACNDVLYFDDHQQGRDT
jgi:hypothetical protein